MGGLGLVLAGLGAILGHLGRAWGHLEAVLGRLGEPKSLIFLKFFGVFATSKFRTKIVILRHVRGTLGVR